MDEHAQRKTRKVGGARAKEGAQRRRRKEWGATKVAKEGANAGAQSKNSKEEARRTRRKGGGAKKEA